MRECVLVAFPLENYLASFLPSRPIVVDLINISVENNESLQRYIVRVDEAKQYVIIVAPIYWLLRT